MVDINKDLYLQAYELYRQWDEVESIKRIMEARELTPQQAWNRYITLWNLLVKIAPRVSVHLHQQKISDYSSYYFSLQKLNAWEKTRGTAT